MRGPPGFRHLVQGPRELWVAESLVEPVLRLELLAPGGLRRALARGGGASGRGHTAVVALPGRDARLHLRPLRRGGALAPLWRDRLLAPARPLAELDSLVRLAAAGAPVPEAALVLARRAGPLWRACVGTLHLEDTLDGVRFLEARPARDRVLRAAAAAGEAVRRLHAAGGRHADLHLKNLLLREQAEGACVWIVDLDRARTARDPRPRERMAQLMRLYRSLLKRDLLDAVGAEGCARFFAAYTDGDRALGQRLLAQLPRERLRIALHALRYR